MKMGQPSSSETLNQIASVEETVNEDHQISVHKLASVLSYSTGNGHTIL
jgi:hypothetical protein